MLERCDRSLFGAMRGLTADSVEAAVGGSLTRAEIDAVVARAGAIVKHFERLSAEKGEGSVMFTLALR